MSVMAYFMDCKMGLWVINGSVLGKRMDVLLNTKGAFLLTGNVPDHMKDIVLTGANKRKKELLPFFAHIFANQNIFEAI